MGSSKWEATRERVLRRDCGVCRCDECKATGALKPAHEVDHHIPLWKGGTEDDENLKAINRDCHKAKTAREAAERAELGIATTRTKVG
jgi:5-methylcytosine-specific restriction enzyme A